MSIKAVYETQIDWNNGGTFGALVGSIGGTRFVYSAERIQSLAHNDPVSTWQDYSIFTPNNATQSGAARPTYLMDQIGGWPLVRFGTSQFMQTSVALPGGNITYAIFVVCRPDAIANDRGLYGQGVPIANQFLGLRLSAAPETVGINHFWWDNSLTVAATVSTTALSIITAFFDGTNRYTRLNGVSLATDTPVGLNLASAVADIGKASVGEHWRGDICEMQLYMDNAVINTTLVERIEGWLARRWNIPITIAQAEAYDDIRLDVRAVPFPAWQYGRDTARRLSPPMAGKLDLELGNSSRRYTFENAAGPLTGNLLPGRHIRVRAWYKGVEYGGFRGRLINLEERIDGANKRVVLSALDGLAELKAAKVSTAMYTNITIDQAILHVLEAAGWDLARYTLQTAKTTLARWWIDNENAFTAIQDLVMSEGAGAFAYIDETGEFLFKNRHSRLQDTNSKTSQATFRDTGTEPVYETFAYDPGLQQVINSATIPLRSYTVAGGLTAIWTGPTPISFAPSETKTYIISTTADGFQEAVDPVAATDYTITAGTISSATLNRLSGKSATLTIVAGSAGATITGLRVRAKTVTIAEESVSHTVDASASQTKYGARVLPSEMIPHWVPTYNDAQSWCDFVVGSYLDPAPQIRIGLSDAIETRLTSILPRIIGDRITIIEAESGMSKDFYIEQIRRWIPSRIRTVAEFVCNRAVDTVFWTLEVAGASELQTTTRIAY